MFKGLGNLGDLFQQAGKLREEMERMQAELAKRTVEREAGGGMVKATANGRQELTALLIEPELLKLGDKEMLQDLVKAAVNAALKGAQELAAEEMKKMTGGLGMLGNLFKGTGG